MNHLRKLHRILETCVSFNNNLCGKLVSSLKSPTTFDGRFKVIWVPFFIPQFNLLSWKLDSFTFKVLWFAIIYRYYTKAKQNQNTFMVLSEKCKTVSFHSSIMKYFAVFPTWSIFSVKMICSVAFRSTSCLCYLLKSVAIIL